MIMTQPPKDNFAPVGGKVPASSPTGRAPVPLEGSLP
jgi:hypothetical protein